MSTVARDLFFAVGTERARKISWTIWHAAEPGSVVVVATLRHVLEVVVIERALPGEDDSEVMVVEHAGRRRELTMYRSASSGYWDGRPNERYPGCDRDVDLGGAPARLVEFRARVPEQLDLFGGSRAG